MSGRNQGFTLIELIIVIVLASALSIVMMQFITTPIDVYVDQSRRGRLIDQTQVVNQVITQDVRLAVPNSLRVGCGGACVELMRAVTGGRYRVGLPGDVLSFVPSDADTSFEALGGLTNTDSLTVSSSASACANGTSSCLVVYNTGFSGTDLWRGDNAATVTAINSGPPTIISFDNTAFSSSVQAFPAQSPGQRFYLTDTPVSFLCDSTLGTIRRYWGYAPQAVQTAVDTHAELLALANPAEHALVADQVFACSFEYAPGTPTRNAVLTIRLSVSEAGETVTLLEQIGVSNLP